VAVVVAVVGVITVTDVLTCSVGHGHDHDQDHVYDHHRLLRLGARLDRGKDCSSEAVRHYAPLAAGLG
jgi:hypothetical protein